MSDMDDYRYYRVDFTVRTTGMGSAEFHTQVVIAGSIEQAEALIVVAYSGHEFQEQAQVLRSYDVCPVRQPPEMPPYYNDLIHAAIKKGWTDFKVISREGMDPQLVGRDPQNSSCYSEVTYERMAAIEPKVDQS